MIHNLNINYYKLVLFLILSLFSCQKQEVITQTQTSDTLQIAQIVFTADLHYGLTRAFRGNVVNSNGVNEAMVAQMNENSSLPHSRKSSIKSEI